MSKKKKLSHIGEDGTATMVDVSEKPVVRREATARGFIRLKPETVAAISDGNVPKGDVLPVARIAGIQATKRASELIPLCHPLPIAKIDVGFELKSNGVEITGRVKTDAKTGVEMEALTAVSVAALTIYDMCKAIDTDMMVEAVELVEKTKSEIES